MTFIRTRSGQVSRDRTMDSIFNNLLVSDFLDVIKVFVYNSQGFKRLWGPILNEVMRQSAGYIVKCRMKKKSKGIGKGKKLKGSGWKETNNCRIALLLKIMYSRIVKLGWKNTSILFNIKCKALVACILTCYTHVTLKT